MNMIQRVLVGLVIFFFPSLAVANAPGGGYEGISTMYYALIDMILIYGAYDAFGKMAMIIAAVVLIPLSYFLI